jgi:hypothetical protein
MTIHDEIVRLRDVVRRVADEPNIDTARKIADEELARPMARWQGLTFGDRKELRAYMSHPDPIDRLMVIVEDTLRRKNGF